MNEVITIQKIYLCNNQTIVENFFIFEHKKRGPKWPPKSATRTLLVTQRAPPLAAPPLRVGGPCSHRRWTLAESLPSRACASCGNSHARFPFFFDGCAGRHPAALRERERRRHVLCTHLRVRGGTRTARRIADGAFRA
jgi:hypothetical protein